MIKTRPIFVTGVCLYLLAWGCYLLFTSFTYLKQPETQAAMEQIGLPYTLQVAMLYLNAILMIVSAMYMMQEANWARWLYLGWSFISIDYHLYINADWHDNVLPIGLYLASALILLVPSANKYFSNVIDYTDYED
jgi:hypothetical protein